MSHQASFDVYFCSAWFSILGIVRIGDLLAWKTWNLFFSFFLLHFVCLFLDWEKVSKYAISKASLGKIFSTSVFSYICQGFLIVKFEDHFYNCNNLLLVWVKKCFSWISPLSQMTHDCSKMDRHRWTISLHVDLKLHTFLRSCIYFPYCIATSFVLWQCVG